MTSQDLCCAAAPKPVLIVPMTMVRRTAAPLFAFLAAGFFASAPARADYVDFSAAAGTGTGNTYTTVVSGVTITVSSSSGPVWGSGDVGFSGYSINTTDWPEPFVETITVEFSTPVTLLSADLVDYWRQTYNECKDASCSATPLGGPTLTYSANLNTPTGVTPSAPGSATTYNYGGSYGGVSYSENTAGWAAGGGSVADYTYNQTLATGGHQIVFTATVLPLSSGSYYSQSYNYFGVRGLEFDTRIPELSASAVTMAMVLLIGAFALVADRRRRATAAI